MILMSMYWRKPFIWLQLELFSFCIYEVLAFHMKALIIIIWVIYYFKKYGLVNIKPFVNDMMLRFLGYTPTTWSFSIFLSLSIFLRFGCCVCWRSNFRYKVWDKLPALIVTLPITFFSPRVCVPFFLYPLPCPLPAETGFQNSTGDECQCFRASVPVSPWQPWLCSLHWTLSFDGW